MLAEPKAVLFDVSLSAPKRVLVIGVGVESLDVSWLVEVMGFVPNAPLGVEEDVLGPNKLDTLCEGPLSVDVAAVPKIEPVVVDDEGCTAGLKIPVAVVLGVWVFQGEGFVPSTPPIIEEDKDSAVPNE